MMRVLLVDDEPAVLRRLAKIVSWEELGCRIVATARDGEDGLAAIEEHSPDIVIADIRMPVIDGLQLAETVAGGARSPDVILLTGFGEFEYARRALRIGVSDYLLKPIDAARLTETVVQVRDRRRASAGASREERTHRWARHLVAGTHAEWLASGEPSPAPPGSTFVGMVIEGQGRLRPELFRDPPGIEIVHTGDREYLVIIAPASQADPTEIGDAVLSAIAPDDRPHTVVGMGRRVNAPARVARSLLEARRAAADAYYRGLGTAIAGGKADEKDEHEVARVVRDAGDAALRRLTALVTTCDASGVEPVLGELEASIRSAEPTPPLARQTLLEVSLSLRHAFAGESDRDETAIEDDATHAGETLRRTIHALDAQTRALIDKRAAKWGRRTEPVSEWVLRYIRTHYNEQITLRTIAGLVNLNPVYLGKRFREETGSSFHDALLRVRMAVAASALRSSNAPIHIIAQQVGYGAPVNFYRGFRKIYGTSPANYRRLGPQARSDM